MSSVPHVYYHLCKVFRRHGVATWIEHVYVIFNGRGHRGIPRSAARGQLAAYVKRPTVYYIGVRIRVLTWTTYWQARMTP